MICRIEDLREGVARGFDAELVGGHRVGVIAVLRNERVYVYRNRCPHRGTPLDWVPGRFVDAAGEHLICATHGALFRFEDGMCVAGPCVGDALEPVSTRLVEGKICVIRAVDENPSR